MTQSFVRLSFIGALVGLLLACGIIDVSASECGTTDFTQTLISKGTATERGEFPFLAAVYLVNQMEFICGGSLISAKHVLTAAHCIKSYGIFHRPADVIVFLGAYDLTLRNETGVVQRDVIDIHCHPDWDEYSEDYDADLAILVLREIILFTQYIRPVCMPPDDSVVAGVNGTIIGWGLTENGTQPHLQYPKQGVTNALNDSYCYTTDYIIAKVSSLRTFCGSGGYSSPNRGDSGGGFFVRYGSAWVQFGIVSAMRSNATGFVDPNSISVYTIVKEFKTWINDTVRQSGGEEYTGSGSELVRLGCYRDKGERQLGLAHWTFPANSPAVCVAACKQAGYKYAGPEATNHCFCGNELPPEKIPDSNCNMKCNGAEVSCGGWWALEIFYTKLEQEENSVRVGCFRDKGVRQLGNTHWDFSRNSPAVCIAACKQIGYKYAGPENGNQCFCGNLLPPDSIPDDNCNKKCNGAELFCGGLWALEVFQTGCRRTAGSTTGSSSGSTTPCDSNEDSSEEHTGSGSELVRLGCYRDKGKRQLGLAHWTFPANSPAVCVAACKQAGYKYAGPEATNHCFCGNELPPEKIPDSNCNMKCNGAEVSCGGWWALEIFDTKLEQEENAIRVGCFRDKGVRQLGRTYWGFSRNSPAVCIAACKQIGYKYAGPENGNQCFCGNLLPPDSIPDDNCNKKCNGAELFCGGLWALEVFETGL